MRVIIDRLRDHIESMSGSEDLLTSYLFYKIQELTDYENTDTPQILTEHYTAFVKSEIASAIRKIPAWNAEDEMKAWKSFCLREVATFFYIRWNRLISSDIFEPAFFSDGTQCVEVESFAEKGGLEPSAYYSGLREIKYLLLLAKASPISALTEIKQFRKFSAKNADKVLSNPFMKKRAAAEKNKLRLSKYAGFIAKYREQTITAAEKINTRAVCWDEMIRLMTASRDVFNFLIEKDDDTMSVTRWTDKVLSCLIETDGAEFAEKLRTKIHTATGLLYSETVLGEDVFGKRNEVILEFISKALDEEIKILVAERSKKTEEI